MARMTHQIKFLLLFLIAKGAAANELRPEIPGDLELNALEQYILGFEAREQKSLKDGERKFDRAWEEARQAYKKEQGRLSLEQLEALKKSAGKYRTHLEENPAGDDRPFVLLNLAQVLSLIGQQQATEDAASGEFSRNEALSALREIQSRYKNFPYLNRTAYLRATILESLGREDDALTEWRVLAEARPPTLETVQALIAIGDHQFKRERAGDALRAYSKAKEIQLQVNPQAKGDENARLSYRIAWAAFRAGEVDQVTQSAASLLSPSSWSTSPEKREKIQQDAIQLLGDALYEANQPQKTQQTLKRRELQGYVGAIGFRTLKRYHANGIHKEAAQLGNFLIEEAPMEKEIPVILQITADSEDKLGLAHKRLITLEKLALLLPKDSLWRARQAGNHQALAEMEEKATKAAELAAASHYDTALAANNPQGFKAAGSFYEILLDFAANTEASNQWRLRRAHCWYFGGELDLAQKAYSALKNEFKIDAETLQIASYQLVLTNERIWRRAYATAAEKGASLKDTPEVRQALAALEKSIDEFAARFPAQTRSVDLLLVGASVNRDMELYENAQRYWQRTLVSQPTITQRTVAIRGLVYASMKTSSPAEVAELARRFLKLENWRSMGLSIGNELHGVLAEATQDEGRRLAGQGKMQEAGKLLTEVASEFPDLPGRDRIYRDGTYMLAIAGDWARAQGACERYFKSGLNQNRADMTYLLARAHEYQLRLHNAAEKYLELAEGYPAHSRAASSLERSERLALAEADFALAARAAALRAERATTSEAKLAHFSRAADHLDKNGDATRALSLARRQLRAAKNPAERLRAQLLIARMTYKTGAEQEGLDDLQILAKDLERQKNKLPSSDYAEVAGATHLLLAEEARRKFDDFQLAERSGQMGEKVALKSRLFDDLATEYEAVIQKGASRHGTEARYKLALAAEQLADEIAGIPVRSAEPVTLKAQNRYLDSVNRLKAVARRYHSANALVQRKDPAQFRGDEWVRKSSLRLANDVSDKPESRHTELMPQAVLPAMPQEWSL